MPSDLSLTRGASLSPRPSALCLRREGTWQVLWLAHSCPGKKPMKTPQVPHSLPHVLGSRHHLRDTCFNFVENRSQGATRVPCGELEGHVPVCPPALGRVQPTPVLCTHSQGLPQASPIPPGCCGNPQGCVMGISHFPHPDPAAAAALFSAPHDTQARTLVPICDPICLS